MFQAGIRQAFLLCAAASVLVSGAAAKTLPLPTHLAGNRAWILNDMNGDKVADIAAAGPNRRDGAGYAREINVNLAGAGKSRFTVRSSGSSIQLSLRDIDGDLDRDLVVLESWSLRPIGIWLNDGEGHFEQGDLAEYASAIGGAESRSFAPVVRAQVIFCVLHKDQTPAVLPAQSRQPLAPFSLRQLTADHLRLLSFVRSNASPRAPPCLS